MTNKFEQLIEYVINDEDAKARELFHEIVVEKSRTIYEEMMKKDELEEAESTEQEDEKAERAGRKVTKDIEYDDKMHESEDLDEDLGGDQADDLIDDVEVEEVGLGEADEDDMDHKEDLEDRVVDLEKEVEDLMAEFEKLMGDEGMGSDELDMDVEVDDVDVGADMDAEEVVDDELETEGMKMPMEEAVNLKAAPKAVTSEESGINTKPVVAANSGAKGAVAKPVKTDTAAETGRSAPTTKDLIGKVQNTPAQTTVKLDAAPKPQLKQETGVNTKTPFPRQ